MAAACCCLCFDELVLVTSAKNGSTPVALVQWIRNRGTPRPLLVTSAKKKGTPVESGAVDLCFEDKALPARSCVAKKRRGAPLATGVAGAGRGA